MNPQRRRFLGATLVALLLAALLAGCGGGEAEEDEAKSNQPVACREHPERCI